MKIDSPFGVLTATGSVLVGYADIVTDVFAAALYFSRGQIYYFALSVLFMALPTAMAVLLQKGWGTRLVALCQCALLREVFLSVSRDHEETAMMGTLKLLESVAEACPSSLLQLYILLVAWMQRARAVSSSDVGTATFSDGSGLLPTASDQVILFSIGVSVLSTAWTLSYACRTEREQQRTGDKSIFTGCVCCVRMEQLTHISLLQLTVALYNLSEVSFRLISVCALFLAVGGLGLAGLAFSFVLRTILAFLCGAFDDLPQSDAQYRRRVATGERNQLAEGAAVGSRCGACYLMSLFAVVKVLSCGLFAVVTDTVWLDNSRLCLFLHVVTALEGAAFFLLLLLLPPPEDFDRDSYRSKIFSMLLVAGAFWCIKCALAMWRWRLGAEMLRAEVEEDRRMEEGRGCEEGEGDGGGEEVAHHIQHRQQGAVTSNYEHHKSLGEDQTPYGSNGEGVSMLAMVGSSVDGINLCDIFDA
jgi:hypothetical protein